MIIHLLSVLLVPCSWQKTKGPCSVLNVHPPYTQVPLMVPMLEVNCRCCSVKRWALRVWLSPDSEALTDDGLPGWREWVLPFPPLRAQQ